MELKFIIYIVLGVGYFIYNIYKKVNGPTSEQQIEDSREEQLTEEYEQAPTQEKSSYKSIDDIINDLHDQGYAKSKHQQPPVRVINEGVDNPERSLAELREEREEVERQKELSASKLSSKTGAAGILPGIKSKKRKVKFDLRKAVLYQAVMDRPKF
jgi:hypothetical protein